MYKDLTIFLNEIDEEYGGDITFIPKVSKDLINYTEEKLNYKLPKIFKYFYKNETNGLIIDNKIIYSIFDKNQKKTYSNNLIRANNPKTSYWFNYKPEIFNDYLVIGSDINICFAIHKHNDIENPSIYICENPNSKGEVILEKLDIDLKNLIKIMINNAFA